LPWGIVAWGIVGCGVWAAPGGDIDVGSDLPAPASGLDAGDANDPLALAATASPPVVCAGGCVTLSAAATGGAPPYTYAWDHGLPPSATTRACPASTTTYTATVTDGSGPRGGELPAAGATASATVTVVVTSPCADAAALACDGGAFEVASGRYAGTFYCPPAPDGGIVSLPGTEGGLVTGNLWLDLAPDPGTGLPQGMLYGQWVVLGAIAFQARLEGTLDCGAGEVTSPWLEGFWGLPGLTPPPEGGAPLTVTVAGAISGDLALRPVAGAPGELAGRIDWGSADAGLSGTCRGTWSAHLQP